MSGKSKKEYVTVGKQVTIGSSEQHHYWMPKVLSFGNDVVVSVQRRDDGDCCDGGNDMSVDTVPCHRECKESIHYVTTDRGESYSELILNNDDFCSEGSIYVPAENTRRCPVFLIDDTPDEPESDESISIPKTTTTSFFSMSITEGKLVTSSNPEKFFFGPMIKGKNVSSVEIYQFGPSLYADDLKQWFWLVGANVNETHLFKSTDGLSWDHVSKLPVLSSIVGSSIARKKDDSLTVHIKSFSGRLLSMTSRTMGKQWGKRETLPVSRSVPTVISSYYTMASVGIGYTSSIDFIRSSGKKSSSGNITSDEIFGNSVYTDDFLESDSSDLAVCSELPYPRVCFLLFC